MRFCNPIFLRDASQAKYRQFVETSDALMFQEHI